jgi:hypothetical protein
MVGYDTCCVVAGGSKGSRGVECEVQPVVVAGCFLRFGPIKDPAQHTFCQGASADNVKACRRLATDTSASGQRMRLAQFISNETEAVLAEWGIFASDPLPAAQGMSSWDLRDHARGDPLGRRERSVHDADEAGAGGKIEGSNRRNAVDLQFETAFFMARSCAHAGATRVHMHADKNRPCGGR